MAKEGWKYHKVSKTIEVIHERGVFKPLQRVDLPEKTKLRMRTESDGLYEVIEDLSGMFLDMKENPLKTLLENRR